MARKKRKDAVDVIEVWIGYSDDKPHIVETELDGKHLCAYRSRKEARKHYEDVRPRVLCVRKRGRRLIARV
jgi:hypothetical protein